MHSNKDIITGDSNIKVLQHHQI